MEKLKNRKILITGPENPLITAVAEKFKGVALFPEKLESAKKFMANVKIKTN